MTTLIPTRYFGSRGVTRGDLAEWIEDMRRELTPGTKVYTTVKQVARSGMSRTIDVHTIDCTGDDPEPRWWSYRIAAVLGWSYDDDREAIRVSGAGMDMGFHLVYSLSSLLYPEGFDCIGERCPASDHVNGDRNYTIGHHHNSGGYALVQKWL
jgi:hypothetical protein